ncbi:MAG TPA: hypothetical protein VEA69_09555 [Tepidisphaeraceae bacterium]|nr:hypothetical protein [Tepidisphaeraceae bacterium]
MSVPNGSVKLSAHTHDGRLKCWKKTIGGRNFHSTEDRDPSGRIAVVLLALRAKIRAGGGTAWDEGGVADADGLLALTSRRRRSA